MIFVKKKLPKIDELEEQVTPEKNARSAQLNCHHSLVHNAFEWAENEKEVEAELRKENNDKKTE